MSIETAVLVGRDGLPLHWRLGDDRSSGFIPDSQTLWDAAWKHRDDLLGIAHSHPCGGTPSASHTDVSTFAAIEAGLADRLYWWIITEEKVALFRWKGPSPLAYAGVVISELGLPWLDELKRHSYKKE